MLQSHRWIGILACASALSLSGLALAAGAGSDASPGLGLKAGLWEVNITYQSVNGRQVLNDQDVFARLLASVDPTDLAIDRTYMALSQSGCENGPAAGGGGLAAGMQTANTQNTRGMPECTLPFAMRMKAEASMRESGANEGASARYRICVTPALAQRDAPILDAQDSCHPDQVQHDGKRETFTFNCGRGGTRLQGKGESRRTFLGHILTLTDFTATSSSKAHYAVHDRTEMKYLGAACGLVKPAAAS